MFAIKTNLFMGLSILIGLVLINLLVSNLYSAQLPTRLPIPYSRVPQGNPLQPIIWDKPDSIKQSSKPLIVVFDNEEANEINNLDKKIKFTSSEDAPVCFIKVILSNDDIKILFPSKKGQKTDQPATAENSDSSKTSVEVELAIKYAIKKVPAIIVCDSYGNNIREIPSSEINTSSKIHRIAKELSAKQDELETTCQKKYKKINNQFKAEQEKKNFSRTVITELLDVARYDGYKYTVNARSDIDEINKVASEEFSSITTNPEDPAIINKLDTFAHKYKGLPAADEAIKTIQEIKQKAKENEKAKSENKDKDNSSNGK
jgi:thioredoxin-related protein